MTNSSPESHLGQARAQGNAAARPSVPHMRFSHPGFPAEYPSPVLEAAMTAAPPPVPWAPSVEPSDIDETEVWPTSAPRLGSEGAKDKREVSEQQLDQGGAKLARAAEPRERQTVDIKPMYFVLGVGLFGVAFAIYLALKASGAL